MLRTFIARNPFSVFAFLTLSYQFMVVIIVHSMIPAGARLHDVPFAHAVFRFRVFGPLFFSMAITAYLEGLPGLRKLFSSFFHWNVPAKWYMLAFTWKFILGYLGMMLVSVLAIAPWPGWYVPDFMSALIGNIAFIVGIAVVEETSWIRFSFTRMQERHNALMSAIIVGLAWGLWYLPMMLIGEGVPDGIPWFAFLFSMFSLTTLLGWVYNTTRSGTILLIMQVISNCAFVFIPMLPMTTNNPAYIEAFVVWFLLVAIIVIIIAGPKDLSRRGRARWNEAPLPPEEPVSNGILVPVPASV